MKLSSNKIHKFDMNNARIRPCFKPKLKMRISKFDQSSNTASKFKEKIVSRNGQTFDLFATHKDYV